jgi:divinyl chlorophyllide a 8-vinyl-reductase
MRASPVEPPLPAASPPDPARAPPARRIFLLGATGTIGRAVTRALLARGHEVVCFLRTQKGGAALPEGAQMRFGDVRDPASLAREGFRGESFDAVVSCIASRTGAAQDAWAIDHGANLNALAAGQAAGVSHFVLLSAICVQKPRLAFQHAKLAFEKALIASGMTYSIVRPTAFFKSLSGQIERVRAGKPFLLFADGLGTACKPISDADLAAFIADCLEDEERRNRILPIGGPGPAITPRAQGEALFALLGREPRFKRAPLWMMDAIVCALEWAARLAPALATKAELARIGRYYATESMLVLDPVTGRYDADATPSTGSDLLFDHYARVLNGEAQVERGAHAVF